MNADDGSGDSNLSGAISLRPTPWPRNKEYVQVYVSVVVVSEILYSQT